MFNAYTLIIGLFTLGGLVTVVWGAMIIVRARNTARWPFGTETIPAMLVTSESRFETEPSSESGLSAWRTSCCFRRSTSVRPGGL